MRTGTHKRTALGAVWLVPLLFIFVACGGGNAGTTPGSPNATAASAASGQAKAAATAPAIQLGVQPCPTAVSTTTYWDTLVPTQPAINKVEKVTCAYLMGIPTLQALVLVRAAGSGSILDAYVYNSITSPSPSKVFMLQALPHGDVKISGYNSLITAEVDANSSINKYQSNAGMTQDLFREFAWDDGASTLVPVAFSGIFPALTRYEAEADQQDTNQGHFPWRLDAAKVALAFASNQKLLKWSPDAQTAVISGGGPQDRQAVVSVKSNHPGGGTIKVSMDRLEGNTNGGIWIITDVATDGMALMTPKALDHLNSPIAVAGKGNAFEGVIGKVIVLDHLYDPLGDTQARGTTGNGNTTFSASVAYTSTFKTGAQEGLVVLYSYSNADGSIAGTVMQKALFS